MNSIAHLPTKDPTAAYVAEQVRTGMAVKRLSQEDIGHRLGLSQAAVSRRISGNVPFDASELAIVARALDVHPGSFFPGWEGNNLDADGMRLSDAEERFILALRASVSGNDGVVGPTGIEPMTSTVEYERLADVLPFARKTA